MDRSTATLLISHDHYVDLLNGKTIQEMVVHEFEENAIITCMDSSTYNVDVSCECRVIEIDLYVGMMTSGYILTLQMEKKYPQQVRDEIYQKQVV